MEAGGGGRPLLALLQLVQAGTLLLPRGRPLLALLQRVQAGTLAPATSTSSGTTTSTTTTTAAAATTTKMLMVVTQAMTIWIVVDCYCSIFQAVLQPHRWI